MDTHRHPAENVLGDYCDGKQCREHVLFSTDPVAPQLIITQYGSTVYIGMAMGCSAL